MVVVAQMARMTRAAVADQLDRPYVEMARLKGLPLRRIVLAHVMPNAVGPIVNAAALSLSYLMGGAIIVETIFNFPGLASLMVNAVTSRDMPLLQACAMIFCAAYLADDAGGGRHRHSRQSKAARAMKRLSAFARALPLSGRIGLATVLFWLVLAVAGPLLAPYPVGAFVDDDVFSGLSQRFWLGSDYLGRDVLSRLLWGARYTVFLAFGAALLASVTGTALALTAAVRGGWLDELLSRAMDTLISIPSKIFALVLVAAFGSSLALLLLIPAITYVPGNFRIARSLAMNLVGLDFVEVARARGEGALHIALREVLPNMIHPLLADFGLRFVFIVLLLSGLSFLGLGVQPPYADLGSLVRENISGLTEGAPAILMPALAIATLTVGANLLIDALKPLEERP